MQKGKCLPEEPLQIAEELKKKKKEEEEEKKKEKWKAREKVKDKRIWKQYFRE